MRLVEVRTQTILRLTEDVEVDTDYGTHTFLAGFQLDLPHRQATRTGEGYLISIEGMKPTLLKKSICEISERTEKTVRTITEEVITDWW